ncbi:hypothetical protein TWF281_007106 [Arthrobotrys megalospora]
MIRRVLRGLTSGNFPNDHGTPQPSTPLEIRPAAFETAEKSTPKLENAVSRRYSALSSQNTRDRRENTIQGIESRPAQNGENHDGFKNNRMENVDAEDLKRRSFLYRSKLLENFGPSPHRYAENSDRSHHRGSEPYEHSEDCSNFAIIGAENSHIRQPSTVENLETSSSINQHSNPSLSGHLSSGLVEFLSKKVTGGIEHTYFDMDTVRYLRRLHKIMMEKDSPLRSHTQYQNWVDICHSSRIKLLQQTNGQGICDALGALIQAPEDSEGSEVLRRQLLLKTSSVIQEKAEQGILTAKELDRIIEQSRIRGYFIEARAPSTGVKEGHNTKVHNKEPVDFVIKEEIDTGFFDNLDEVTLDLNPNVRPHQDPVEEWVASVHNSVKQQVLKDIRVGNWTGAEDLINFLARKFRFVPISENYYLFSELPPTWAILSSYTKTRLRKWEVGRFPITEALDGLTHEVEISPSLKLSDEERCWTLPAAFMMHKGQHWRQWMFLAWMIRAESAIFKDRNAKAAKKYWARGWLYLTGWGAELEFGHLGDIVKEAQYLARIIERHLSDGEYGYSFGRTPDDRYRREVSRRKKWYKDITSPLPCSCCRDVLDIHERVYPPQREIGLEFDGMMHWARGHSSSMGLSRPGSNLRFYPQVRYSSQTGDMIAKTPPSPEGYEYGRLEKPFTTDLENVWHFRRRTHWN